MPPSSTEKTVSWATEQVIKQMLHSGVLSQWSVYERRGTDNGGEWKIT